MDQGLLSKFTHSAKVADHIRGQFKLGTVLRAFAGGDGRVRKVQVMYKNPKPGEAVNEYHGRGFVTVERAVNKLVVLIPREQNKDKKLNYY